MQHDRGILCTIVTWQPLVAHEFSPVHSTGVRGAQIPHDQLSIEAAEGTHILLHAAGADLYATDSRALPVITPRK